MAQSPVNVSQMQSANSGDLSDLRDMIPWKSLSTSNSGHIKREPSSDSSLDSQSLKNETKALVDALRVEDGSLSQTNSHATGQSSQANRLPQKVRATVASSKKSVGLTDQAASPQTASLQSTSTQESPAKLRFNVASYTGKLSQTEQLFSATKVDPFYTSSAVVVPNTQREQIHAEDPNVVVNWEDRVYTWAAPQFYHKPLYFQQVNLERYGIGASPILRPVQSISHFYGSIIVWPAKMIWSQPTDCTYSLGHQRPGDCVNYQR